MPIEGVVLQMKSMHIDAVVNFPFPTPPDQLSLKKAETILTHLGAISVSPIVQKGSMEVLTTATIGGHVTDLGKAMSLFPLSPRFSRMLVGGRQHGCLPYVVSIVSALSVGDPFLRDDGIDDERDEDEDEALSHLHNAAVRAKEARKLRRRAFFQSQEVCLIMNLFIGRRITLR
jgi:ATP-dependent RNA helicase DHX37/DHR1